VPDLRLQIELLQSLLHPDLKVVRSPQRLLGVEPGVGLTSLLLELQILGAWSQ